MNDKVEISKAELQDLLNQRTQLLAENSQLTTGLREAQRNSPAPAPMIHRAVTDRTVKVAMVSGKPVIGFANRGTVNRPSHIYERPDPNNPNSRLLYVDLVLKGAEKPLPVNYNEFMREHEQVTCKILDTKDTPYVIEQGYVPRQEVQDYRMKETGDFAPVQVIGKTVVFTVELPDGNPLEIAAEYVNMIG